MSDLQFYLRHTLRHLNRNRQRTLFVLFCIAVGVAAIVALRSLGLMIEATVLRNMQADLRGDIRISAPAAFGALAPIDPDLVDAGSLFLPPAFTPAGLERISAWVTGQGWELNAAQLSGSPARVRAADGATERTEIISPLYIDPQLYPFYAELPLVQPAGGTLAAAFHTERAVVLAAQTAASLGVGVGDQVYLSGAPDPFTVTALAADTAEASLLDLNSLLIPFVYLSRAGFGRSADTLFIRLPPDTPPDSAREQFLAAFPDLPVMTTDDLRAVNATVTDWITRLVTTAGLASLLIGGIGIINTMLVTVRRRTLEIGVLKTIGLQGRQITLLFLTEALILGVLGSLLGSAIGLALLRLLQGIGEQLAARPLAFAIYPEALLLGLVTGIVVTVVFGFLPTLSAGRVRPNVVLNPTAETAIPAAARWQSILLLLGMGLIIGVLAGVVLRNLWLGIGLTLLAGAVLGILFLFLWVVVLLLTILPTGRSVRLKLVQRAIATHHSRTAATLLALATGMVALSLLVVLSRTLTNVIDATFNQQLGGNVLAIGQTAAATRALQAQAAELPGVRNVLFEELFSAELIAIDATPIGERMAEARRIALAEQPNAAFVDLTLETFAATAILQKPSANTDYLMAEGQDITPESTRAIVVQRGDAPRWLGIRPGSSLTLRLENGAETTLTVSGMSRLPAAAELIVVQTGAPMPNTGIISADAIPPGTDPLPGSVIIDSDPAQLDAVIQALAEIPDTILFEATLIQSFITTLLQQLTALPLAIAVLALFAGSVIIANTVSLVTLERRREIGIMKALGLTTRQVLGLLLLENGLLGLLGGILGTSLAAALALASLTMGESNNLAQFPLAALLALIALAVALALAATLLTAVGAARTKPLIVLRHE